MRRKPILKADSQSYFLFSLAKELGMTLSQLSQVMTREEMVGWAAYFSLKNDEEQKQRDGVQNRAAQRTQVR
tara:strand:+ start:1708 stop:1923 length:216 start_codon:yes stop_codon:yes gene_type:complete